MPFSGNNSNNQNNSEETQRLKELLRKTRKENTRKFQELDESYKSQLSVQAEVYLLSNELIEYFNVFYRLMRSISGN